MTMKRSIREKKASIKVPLTAGNIRNGYVSVREHLWFFPKSSIRGQRINGSTVKPCVLELPGHGTIETEIDAEKGIFRWRGWRRFFRQHGVSDGDHLIFVRNNHHHFAVTIEHAVLAGLGVAQTTASAEEGRKHVRKPVRRCNDLSGDEWLRYSVSVWSDIRKTADELTLSHPAMFPTMLCERLISMFLRRRGKDRVLDPFMGSGSTLIAARNMGKIGIGIDLSEQYVQLAKTRLDEPNLFSGNAPPYEIHQGNAREVLTNIRARSVDFCITSPPYWDILNQKRTADYKDVRHYGNLAADLGTVSDYHAFIDELGYVFEQVQHTLRPGAYCCVVVMDLRKKDRFFPFHNDLASRMQQIGFVYDDLIVWDRGAEYNNLRPLGYPSVFRVNKVHEFILIFQKPPQGLKSKKC